MNLNIPWTSTFMSQGYIYSKVSNPALLCNASVTLQHPNREDNFLLKRKKNPPVSL